MKLNAKKRELKGKKVKTLREEGMVPAVIYGAKRDSEDLVLDLKEFHQVYIDAGENKLINLEIEKGKPALVLIKEVQKDFLRDQFLHVSFYEVDQNTKLTAQVPIELTGISMAVKNNIGFLVNPMDEVTLRCFPKDIPELIKISIDDLNEIGDSITLKDVELPENVEFLSTADLTTAIAYIAPPQKEIVEEEVVEEAEGEEGAEGEKGEEGEEGVEGEKKEGDEAGEGQEEEADKK
ncbi:50S ribosomal protein L25 [Candidatus Dojkabacteria bacterium]|nr:50S ribosomal protein L25 [Candidatus Dojkabacteria bacterium]